MSEEKLYAVKNDDGKYWNFADRDGFFELEFASCSATDDERYAKNVVRDHGGHVVPFVEEPEKVVLSKEQAQIVEDAHDNKFPADYITGNSDHEKLLMEAFVNGYTVAKEKKYNVKVPYAVESYFKKIGDKYCIAGDTFYVDLDEDLAQFTESEIEHYGLQDCEKEEVNDDAD